MNKHTAQIRGNGRVEEIELVKLGEDNDLVDQFQLLSQLYVWLERLGT